MLVLTLKVGHSIKIGDDITIHFFEKAGQQLGIGITAPKEMPILRDNAVKTTRG